MDDILEKVAYFELAKTVLLRAIGVEGGEQGELIEAAIFIIDKAIEDIRRAATEGTNDRSKNQGQKKNRIRLLKP